MLFTPIASGALITAIGYYVPMMWFGASVATIGSGLLYTLKVNTSGSLLSAFQFIAGLGLGTCTQIPFNAVQYVLSEEHMAMGSALVSFCNSLGPILGTNIGQAIFSNLLVQRLANEPDVDAKAIVLAGPTNIASAGASSSAVRQAFNYALTRTFLLAVAVGLLAFGSSLAMEWGNVKSERNHGHREVEGPGTEL